MKRFSYSYLLLVFPILRACMPWLQYRTKAILVLPFLVLWFIIEFCKPASNSLQISRLRKAFIGITVSLLCYKLLPFVYEFIGYGKSERFVWYNFIAELVANYFFLIIVLMSVTRRKHKELRFLLYIFLLSFIFNGLMAYLSGNSGIADSGSARALVGARREENIGLVTDELITVAKYGLGGYLNMYIDALIVPMLVYSAVKIKELRLRALCCIACLGNLFSIRVGGLATPLFVCAFGLLLILLCLVFKLRKSLITIGVVVSLFLITFAYRPTAFSFMEPIFRGVSTLTESPVYKGRFVSLADAVSGNKETYAYKRYQLQKESLETFLSDKFFFGGGNEAKNGGHSEILDAMARYGLLALICFVTFWIYYLSFCERLGAFALGRAWLPMIYVYVGVYSFAVVSNPISLGIGQFFIVPMLLSLYFPDCLIRVSANNSRKMICYAYYD